MFDGGSAGIICAAVTIIYGNVIDASPARTTVPVMRIENEVARDHVGVRHLAAGVIKLDGLSFGVATGIDAGAFFPRTIRIGRAIVISIREAFVLVVLPPLVDRP